MRGRGLATIVAVFLLAGPALALDMSGLHSAVEMRLMEIGDPPARTHAREARHLEKALPACTTCANPTADPRIAVTLARRALRRVQRSRTADAAVLLVASDLLHDLYGDAERALGTLELEQWVLGAPGPSSSGWRRGRGRGGESVADVAARVERMLWAAWKVEDDPGHAARRLQRCLRASWAICPPEPLGLITFLQMSDTHGHVDGYGPKGKDLRGKLGGLARVATILGLVDRVSNATRSFHIGDFFTGTFFHNAFFGVPELQILVQLGVDGMALGNHEFDLGPDVLTQVIGQGFAGDSIPLLGANMDLSDYAPLQPWIRSSMIEEIGGVRVGFFGLVVPDNPTSFPAPVVLQENVAAIAVGAVQDLRGAGAQVVVCLSHLGLAGDRALAAAVGGIDLILGGHSHALLTVPVSVTNPAGSQTHITHVGSFYDHVGRIRFTFEGGAFRLHDYALLVVDDEVPEDLGIRNAVDVLRLGVEVQFGDVFDTVIARAKRPMTGTWNPKRADRDTPLGNLVTDAYLAKTGTEIAIAPLGLVREPIHAGPIVPADVFRVVSYGYDEDTGLGLKLATVDITGAELVAGLEGGLAYYGIDHDFFLQVAGMTFDFDPTRPIGQRVVASSVRIGGQPLDPARTYSLTVNSGVVMLLPVLGVEVTNVVIRDDLEYEVLRDHIEMLGKVDARSEGRIRDVSP
jgi:5'-nucleotidase / UDP-sugar diphosphatase